MPTFEASIVAALASVIDAARKTLRDLEAEEIPPRIRKVAGYAGGRLPPPLAASLLSELDANDVFRGKVADRYEGDDEVASAFLLRDERWWAVVAAATSSAAATDATRALTESERALALERDKAAVLKKKLKAAQATPVSTADGGEARLEATKQALERQRAAAAKLEGQLDAQRSRESELEAELAAAHAARDELAERLRESKAERAQLLRRLEEGEVEAVVGDPVELARALDRMAQGIAPYRPVAETGTEPEFGGESVALPPGIAPDTAAAVEALAERAEPIVFLVDGHNVIGARTPGALGDPEARKLLVTDLGRLARRFPAASILAVFDSALAGGREETVSDEGVIVRFSPSGATADDLLADEAAAIGRTAVVFSNDREVRHRAAAAGALPLWADALVRWLEA